MTPLVKSLVSLTEEAADYVWFDMGTLARYSIDWTRTQPNLPFERVAICGRDKFGDRFLVLCDHAEDNTFLVCAWSLLSTHYTKTPVTTRLSDDFGKHKNHRATPQATPCQPPLRHPTTNNPKRSIWRPPVLYELPCLQGAPMCTIIKSLDGTRPQ